MKDGNGIEVVGKNGTARIMSYARDENAISHLYALMSSGLTEGSTVRVMADYHEGKGAISAQLGEKALIPFNMRDGIAVCVGKGNEEYNYSAPHGCGRLMSRSQAKKALNLDDVKRDMHDSDVFTTSLDYALDEAPDAYKDCSSILDLIGDTVDVLKVLKPVYNIKGK